MCTFGRLSESDDLAPLEDIEADVLELWAERASMKDIVKHLNEKVIDSSRYGIGYTSFRTKIVPALGLETTRSQKHTVESIDQNMRLTRERYPMAGARDLTSILFHEYGMLVSGNVIIEWCNLHEPQLVRQRLARKLKRSVFWTAGVNDMLAVDQHDKWKPRFGLALHCGMDPFSGHIHWIKMYWTNSNPKIVLSYYLEWVRSQGSIPLVTQSDLGSENYGIANAHTALRHMVDPTLEGTIQHRWMRQRKNVKPEIVWRQKRQRWSPGFEKMLQVGLDNGWYDMNRPFDKYVFRWKRADRKKVLPHGVPHDIHFHLEKYGSLDFKIGVPSEYFDTVERMYAPSDDPVFQLVPQEFAVVIEQFYTDMGRPAVTYKNAWDVYRALVDRFEAMGEGQQLVERCGMLQTDDEDQVNLTPPEGVDGYEFEGGFYMGGVRNGRGLERANDNEVNQMEWNEELALEAEFTDDEDTMAFDW